MKITCERFVGQDLQTHVVCAVLDDEGTIEGIWDCTPIGGDNWKCNQLTKDVSKISRAARDALLKAARIQTSGQTKTHRRSAKCV